MRFILSLHRFIGRRLLRKLHHNFLCLFLLIFYQVDICNLQNVISKRTYQIPWTWTFYITYIYVRSPHVFWSCWCDQDHHCDIVTVWQESCCCCVTLDGSSRTLGAGAGARPTRGGSGQTLVGPTLGFLCQLIIWHHHHLLPHDTYTILCLRLRQDS